MGRKKLKTSEKVSPIRAYAKKKHHARIMQAIKNEVDKINLEELLEKQKENESL